MIKNNRGSTALGIAGIVTVIILFEVLAIYFTFAITNENVKNVFVSNCDCSSVVLGVKVDTSCSVYLAKNGITALFDKCENQVSTNQVLKDSLSNKFWNLSLVGIIIFMLNLVLIFITILIFRGVSG